MTNNAPITPQTRVVNADGTPTRELLNFLLGIQSDGSTGFQPASVVLDGLAALSTSLGFVTQTSAAYTFLKRTLGNTAPIQISNPAGTAGNPTISVDAGSESAAGVLELATNAETVTGTSTTLATHPAGVAAAIAAAASSPAFTTWTPVYSPTAGALGAVSYDSGTYGRVWTLGSNLVVIDGAIITDSLAIGTASGSAQIGGLPYTSANTSAAFASVYIGYATSWAGEEPISGLITPNSTVIQPYYRSAVDSTALASAVADWTTGASANANQIYFAAAYFR